MKSKRQDQASRGGSRSPLLLGRFGYAALFGAGALALAACDTGGGAGSGGTGATGGAGGNGGAGAAGGGGNGGAGGGEIGKVSKVDILVSVDNSRSMADKQQILSLALGDLLSGLANPPCLDASGQIVGPDAQGACPAGASRQYQPVSDIHIGIVSSSLGGHGSDACDSSGSGKASNNDMGHLLNRTDPLGGATVPTYENKGFLAWDPNQQMNPPGESNPVALAQNFSDMVLGVGQIGCGYESQLESVYRFLVDPAPYGQIGLDGNGIIQKQGVDTALLEQRKAFLRPDSMLVVLSLSDENDCSIRENGQFYFAAQQKGSNGSPFHLPAARAVCATDPNDQCCYSCGQQGPMDESGNPLCAADASCTEAGGTTKYLDDLSDNISLRCFEQKRRFGIDFLYPVERYVEAFTSQTIVDPSGQVVPNPVFSDLDSTDSVTTIRDPGLVVVAGIVGVPWQDIAKNPNDLRQGVKSAAELSQENASGKTTWDIILGDLGNNVAPLDPFMIESSSPRSGVNPVTGTATTAPGGAPNAINGSEHTILKQDDLQYACIMPIPTPRDCSDPGAFPSCDCVDPGNDNPLCEATPNSGDKTLQTRAKAYPGRRQLAVLEGLGNQAVVGSICAAQITDPAQGDYAYRPVVASLLDRVKTRLQ